MRWNLVPLQAIALVKTRITFGTMLTEGATCGKWTAVWLESRAALDVAIDPGRLFQVQIKLTAETKPMHLWPDVNVLYV
jgi:hypothetical protein